MAGQIQQTVGGFSALSLLIIDDAAQVTDSLYPAPCVPCSPSAAATYGSSAPIWRTRLLLPCEGGNRWERFTLPATECARIPPEFLEEEREAGGARYFGQGYLCEFHSTDDALFDE